MEKALFISSTGGHLTELLKLDKLFDRFDYYIVTEKQFNNMYLREKYKGRVSYLIFGTKDHKLSYPFKFLANIFISIFLFVKIRPKYIITTGTHTAVPMCYIGKLFRKKIIFIETFANSETKTLSGKMIYPIADLFVVQHKTMLKLYPNAKYFGGIF